MIYFRYVILPIAIFIGACIFYIMQYLKNKKETNMNKTLYATITDVSTSDYKERDNDTNKLVTVTEYTFSYQYNVNGNIYTGVGISKSWKRKGQTIKIYYNENEPEKSETSEGHNEYLYPVILVVSIIVIGIILGIAGR